MDKNILLALAPISSDAELASADKRQEIPSLADFYRHFLPSPSNGEPPAMSVSRQEAISGEHLAMADGRSHRLIRSWCVLVNQRAEA